MRRLWKYDPKYSSDMYWVIFVQIYFSVGVLFALVCCSFNGAQLAEDINLKMTWDLWFYVCYQVTQIAFVRLSLEAQSGTTRQARKVSCKWTLWNETATWWTHDCFLYSQRNAPIRSHVFKLQSGVHLCKTTSVDKVFCFVFYLNLWFGLIWVFFFFLRSDQFLYLIKPVTLYQVLHLNSDMVWLCLCSRVVLDSMWVESAAVLFRPGWFSKLPHFFLPVNRVNRVGLNFKTSFCSQHQQRLSEYFSHLSRYESSWNHLLSPKSRRATPDGRLNQILSHIRISTWDALELLISSLLMRAEKKKKIPPLEEQQAAVRQPLSSLYPL